MYLKILKITADRKRKNKIHEKVTGWSNAGTSTSCSKKRYGDL